MKIIKYFIIIFFTIIHGSLNANEKEFNEWLVNFKVYALEKKIIAGAGLDVTEVEPLANTSKLLNHKNVILTPHALCWTDECFNDIACEAINSIINFVDEKPILNQVNS